MNIKREDLEKALMIKAILEKEFYKDYTVPALCAEGRRGTQSLCTRSALRRGRGSFTNGWASRQARVAPLPLVDQPRVLGALVLVEPLAAAVALVARGALEAAIAVVRDGAARAAARAVRGDGRRVTHYGSNP